MKRRFLTRVMPLVAASGLVLAGCGGDDGSSTGTSSGDGPSVVAAFYPLAFIAERVAGEHASVENLTQPGLESHDLELTAQQVGAVADADLALYLQDFQPAVDEAIEQNSSSATLDAASVVELHPADHDHSHAEESDDEHSEEEHADEAESDDEHDHGDSETDPHFWLDPTNVATVAQAVADELAELDTDNADTYESNADALAGELEELDTEFSDGLAQCERSLIVVSHEAYGYLTERYGLEQLGVAGLDPDSEPSPARVAEVHDTVESEGVTTLFYEPLTSADIVNSIAGDLGLETAVLDPIEGLTDETADEDYLSLMRQNVEALRAANGCE